MGFGGGNYGSQDQSLISSLLGQYNGLLGQQQQASAAVPGQDAAILQTYNRTTQQMLGQTPQQQKKAVNLGVMDFIKTAPGGLANTPATGKLGLF